MFAAAAIFAQMALDVAVAAAQWVATRAFIILIMAVMLPWVLRKVFLWGFDYLSVYGQTMTSSIMAYISSATDGQVSFSIDLTSVGGFLAQQTGLLEYCSIIISGWGIYWVVAILSKTPRSL